MTMTMTKTKILTFPQHPRKPEPHTCPARPPRACSTARPTPTAPPASRPPRFPLLVAAAAAAAEACPIRKGSGRAGPAAILVWAWAWKAGWRRPVLGFVGMAAGAAAAGPPRLRHRHTRLRLLRLLLLRGAPPLGMWVVVVLGKCACVRSRGVGCLLGGVVDRVVEPRCQAFRWGLDAQ
jgi:hypothetical protein